jgi:hypothetical protein
LYEAKVSTDRHSYEVIEENSACKLYFDLEFKKKLNPGIDPDVLMRRFKEVVLEFFNSTFGDAAPVDESCFIDLGPILQTFISAETFRIHFHPQVSDQKQQIETYRQ